MVTVAHDDNDAITVTWQQLPNTPPVTSTTVTYCPTSSPNCGNSMNCTSPCTISGLRILVQNISLQLFQTTTVEVLLDALGMWLPLKQLVSAYGHLFADESDI